MAFNQLGARAWKILLRLSLVALAGRVLLVTVPSCGTLLCHGRENDVTLRLDAGLAASSVSEYSKSRCRKHKQLWLCSNKTTICNTKNDYSDTLLAMVAAELAQEPAPTLPVKNAPDDFPRAKPRIASAAGQAAPDFTLRGEHSKPVKLLSLRGQKVLLIFYRGYW